MKVKLIVIGKTDDSYVGKGLEMFSKRINKYHSFDIIVIPDIKKSKKLPEEQQKRMEAESLLKVIGKFDSVVLLDEQGKMYSSAEFAEFFEKKMGLGIKSLAFVIGGPYGFSKEIYNEFPEKVSLSKMTFSHQMVRLLFMEQLYRINTIIKGEPYHHQ